MVPPMPNPQASGPSARPPGPIRARTHALRPEPAKRHGPAAWLAPGATWLLAAVPLTAAGGAGGPQPTPPAQEAAAAPAPASLPPEPSATPQDSATPGADPSEAAAESAAPAPIELDAEALARELAALAAAYPQRTRLATYGRSAGGLPLWCLEALGPDAAQDAPALLLVAALDGWRCFETRAALGLAEALLAGDWPEVGEAERLAARRGRLLLVPRADPDGAAERLAGAAAAPRPAPADQGPRDGDRDGRLLDGRRADLDGDGAWRWMRFEDEDGALLLDPLETRLLRAARPELGERGRWRLEPEGLDGDGDGRIAEDLPNPERPAVQFPPGWAEHSAPAGPWPGHLPEARALMDLVLAHPELWGALVLDAYDTLVAPGEAPSAGRLPGPGFLAADLAWAKSMGEVYRERTGIRERPRGDASGRFERWLYEHRGLWTVSARLFDLPVEAAPNQDGGAAGDPAQGPPAAPTKRTGPKDADFERESGRLRWIDARPEEAWRFAPWKPWEHPELGRIEIGGWHPLASYDPPPADQAALSTALTGFLADLLASTPRVEFGAIAVEPLGANLYRVEVELLDAGRARWASAAAERARLAWPLSLRFVLPEGAERLAGELEQRGDGFPDPGRSRRHELLLRARPGQSLSLELSTQNAGRDGREVSLP